MLNVIIYNPNSIGGNFIYANCLFDEYTKRSGIICNLILPKNAKLYNNVPGLFKILLSDVCLSKYKVLKRLYFIYRSCVNPILLFLFIARQKPSLVIFNDYDQISSIFWVPCFFPLKLKHKFAVILHDPDRDNYLKSKLLSQLTMSTVMRLMHYGLYHETLPERYYYKKGVIFSSIPHGVYHNNMKPDRELSEHMAKLKETKVICTILGNIRKEKNYELAIQSLQNTKNIHLVVAGKDANSGYSSSSLIELATTLGVEKKVTFILKYLTDEQISAVLDNTDVLLLNYSSSFSSQSGILNLAAPFKSNLVISKTNSALYKIARQYNLAKFVEADSLKDLQKLFQDLDISGFGKKIEWSDYIMHASWEKNVDITLNLIYGKVQ